MTRKVFIEDSYLQTLQTSVISVSGNQLILDATIFYPMGGGQPGDTGTLHHADREIAIIDTRKGDDPDTVVHLLDTDESGLQPGDEVTLSLDWERRYAHMKMHTCMHLLGSLIPVPVTGGAVGAEKSRLDFNLGDHQLDKEELTSQLNALIRQGTDLSFESITDAELDANPGLVRTMSVQPPRGSGVIRMVRINGIDYQPCGGTHLKNTAEIGEVTISKIENKGKQNRRVNIVFA
ncbi:MAG: alanyl-tRNA editing protein [Pseudomonadales bacterium]|nr:alanyl-tRNA editing protein [Pseudomonadales bacterium]